MDDNFSYSIEQNCGIISEGKGGWHLELNLVSWGGRPAKYDLRSWAPDHEKMGKGVTLSKEDLRSLREVLDKMDLD